VVCLILAWISFTVPLTLMGLPVKIPHQFCLNPEIISNGPMGGWLSGRFCLCDCVSCLGSRLRSPCKGMIIPSLPIVNQKTDPGQKMLRHFSWPIRVLKKGNFKSLNKGENPEFQDSHTFPGMQIPTFKYT
jgi:hypothetical protein